MRQFIIKRAATLGLCSAALQSCGVRAWVVFELLRVEQEYRFRIKTGRIWMGGLQ